MNRSVCATLIDDLARYAAIADTLQRDQANRIAAFVQSCDAPWLRSTLEGHLTASAWIVDESREHALLIHHKKLDRWLQPGGHIDDADKSFLDAALREAREETGLELQGDGVVSLFDVDVHPIPARRNEPAHVHYDLRFLFVADSKKGVTMNADETNDLRWFPMQSIAGDTSFDTSVRRMASVCTNFGAGHLSAWRIATAYIEPRVCRQHSSHANRTIVLTITLKISDREGYWNGRLVPGKGGGQRIGSNCRD